MNDTKIEWCDRTLNPVVGCTFGCTYCYARRIFERFHPGQDFAKPKYYPHRLKQLADKDPHRIFMTSMSDPADWQPDWKREIITAINANPQHQYLLLSKRPGCYMTFWYQTMGDTWKPENVWFGATVTNQSELVRLTSLPPSRSFLSVEPIQGPIDLSKRNNAAEPFVSWVIIGAESGSQPGKVTPQREWISQIVAYCDSERVPVFMKDSLIPIVGSSNMRRDWPEGMRKEPG
jgi:protein gp37